MCIKTIALSCCLTAAAAAACDISVICVQRHGCIHGTQAGQVKHIGHIVRKKEEEEAVELG